MRRKVINLTILSLYITKFLEKTLKKIKQRTTDSLEI